MNHLPLTQFPQSQSVRYLNAGASGAATAQKYEKSHLLTFIRILGSKEQKLISVSQDRSRNAAWFP